MRIENLGNSFLGICVVIAMRSAALDVTAAYTSTTEREFIEVQTRLNAILVAVVDWAAYEIRESPSIPSGSPLTKVSHLFGGFRLVACTRGASRLVTRSTP